MTSGGAPRTRPPAPHWRGPKRGPSIASGWKRPGRRRARCYPRAWPSIRRSPPAGCCYPVPLRRRRMRTAARRPRGPGGRSRSRRGLDGWRTAGSSPLGTTPRRRCCRTRRARLHNIPAGVKEALHEIPAGYTDLVGDGDERSRHRLVANGWHWGVARRLLAMLMALTVAQPAEASVPAGPRTTTVSWMAAPVRRRIPGHEPPIPPGVHAADELP